MILLTGTPKQVSWAIDRREQAIPMLHEAIEILDREHGLTDLAKDLASEVIEEMKINTEAKFWINLPLNTTDLAGIIQAGIIKKIKEMKK